MRQLVSRRRRVGVALVLILLSTIAMSENSSSSAARPPLLFGAYVPPAPEQGMGAYDALEDAAGASFDIVSFYQAWGDGNHGEFHQEWLSRPIAAGKRVLLTWEPWVSGRGPKQPAYSLSRITSGRHDAYIRTWAKGLKALGKTVYLRPMHEMNGNWYPWGGTVNGNSPRAYRRAWRHVHGIFDEVGATNVRWVWSPYAIDVPSANDLEKYFPGTAQVDVLALDGYNWGGCVPEYGGWQSFGKLFRSAYARIVRLAAKPVWIAETASAVSGGDKATWVKNMFAAVENDYPRVRAIVWFSMKKECDWRLDNPRDAATTVGRLLRSLS